MYGRLLAMYHVQLGENIPACSVVPCLGPELPVFVVSVFSELGEEPGMDSTIHDNDISRFRRKCVQYHTGVWNNLGHFSMNHTHSLLILRGNALRCSWACYLSRYEDGWGIAWLRIIR